MRLVSNTAGTDTYLDFGDFVEGACEAWGDAEGLTTGQQKTVLDVGKLMGTGTLLLRTNREKRAGAERAYHKAVARFHVRDKVLDRVVMATIDAVRNGPAGRSNDHPIMHELLRDQTGTEITRAAIREEPEIVARLLDRLEKLEDFDGKGALLEKGRATVAKSITARDSLDTAEKALNAAADDEMQARLGVRTAAEQGHGMLQAAFPGRRDLVESFFPRPSGGHQGGDEPATPPAPTPGSAPAH